jgi:hypothetical protein
MDIIKNRRQAALARRRSPPRSSSVCPQLPVLAIEDDPLRLWDDNGQLRVSHKQPLLLLPEHTYVQRAQSHALNL